MQVTGGGFSGQGSVVGAERRENNLEIVDARREGRRLWNGARVTLGGSITT